MRVADDIPYELVVRLVVQVLVVLAALNVVRGEHLPGLEDIPRRQLLGVRASWLDGLLSLWLRLRHLTWLFIVGIRRLISDFLHFIYRIGI